MNKVVLTGRFVKDPDVRYSNGEKTTAVSRFTLAVDRRFTGDGNPTLTVADGRLIRGSG